MHKLISWLAAVCILSFACGTDPSQKPMLIAAASNMQYVLDELVEDFESSTGIKCELVISSSGKLAAQIQAGAAYDVFLSADQYYPQYLAENGLTNGSPKTYAAGKLIAWSTRHTLDEATFNFQNPHYDKIAIANPKIAPYGKAAVELLHSLKIFTELESKLVFGENISQVNQFVKTGSADIGISGQSIINLINTDPKATWIMLPDSLYQPILQDLVLLNGGKTSLENSQKFMDYLFSDEANLIFRRFGYESIPSL